MEMVTLYDIKQAFQRIQRFVPATALMKSLNLEDLSGFPVLLKLENLNISGSFKIRGAFNSLLQVDPSKLSKGVVAASAGNHAQGVAYACKQLKVGCHIFMPTTSPLVKIAATKQLGAKITQVGDFLDDSFSAAQELAQREGMFFLHPFADPNVIAGQGTIGLELLDQSSDIGVVFASIGGGGMISGLACALKEVNPSIKVIGVEAAAMPSMTESIKAGIPTKMSSAGTIADGIAVKRPCELTLQMVSKYVDDVWTVGEQAIAGSVMELMERDHMLAEGSGAITVAALRQNSKKVRKMLPKGKKAVCVISGGNIDLNLLKKIIPYGQKYSGRLMRMTIHISDRPGGLAQLLKVVGEKGANLIEVSHNRLFGETAYHNVVVDMDLETEDREHQQVVAQHVLDSGYQCEKIEPKIVD